MKLQFTHAGRERTLAKHPAIATALRRGEITEEQAEAAPWYLRCTVGGRERTFKLTAASKTAIAAAKDILNGHQQHPQKFSQWLAEKDAQRGITLGKLAETWITAGCPFDAEAGRTADAAAQLKSTVERALTFWRERRAASVSHNLMAEFVTWRRQNTRGTGDGSRSADLELAALSCLCQWAVLTERLEKNPFAERKRFQKRANVEHCHEHMPADDDQFHRILAWLFAQETAASKVAGAYLAFSTLTGLRPGEPALLQRVDAATKYPGNLALAAPGLIYPMPDGSQRMKVARLKRGQNPAITLHPTAKDFLAHWAVWQTQHDPAATHLFPISQESVADRLDRACVALKLPAIKPHGFGRAYYVRVRRSQGADDAAIAVELGQSSKGSLIRSVYGDPLDPVGGNLHDWLPETGQPAWSALLAAPANVVAITS